MQAQTGTTATSNGTTQRRQPSGEPAAGRNQNHTGRRRQAGRKGTAWTKSKGSDARPLRPQTEGKDASQSQARSIPVTRGSAPSNPRSADGAQTDGDMRGNRRRQPVRVWTRTRARTGNIFAQTPTPSPLPGGGAGGEGRKRGAQPRPADDPKPGGEATLRVARGRTRRWQTDAVHPTGGKRMKQSDEGPSPHHLTSLTQGETPSAASRGRVSRNMTLNQQRRPWSTPPAWIHAARGQCRCTDHNE